MCPSWKYVGFVINCLITLFWYHYTGGVVEPHNRILKQSLIYFVIARYKERNMRILLWSLIKFLLHQHCLKFFTFIFVTTNQHQPCLSLPCLSRTFWRCVSQVFQCQLQGNIPSSSCEKIFSKFGRQDAFWGSFDTGSRIIHIESLSLNHIFQALPPLVPAS